MGSLNDWIIESNSLEDIGVGAFQGITTELSSERSRITNLMRVIGKKLVTIWTWAIGMNDRFNELVSKVANNESTVSSLVTSIDERLNKSEFAVAEFESGMKGKLEELNTKVNYIMTTKPEGKKFSILESKVIIHG